MSKKYLCRHAEALLEQISEKYFPDTDEEPASNAQLTLKRIVEEIFNDTFGDKLLLTIDFTEARSFGFVRNKKEFLDWLKYLEEHQDISYELMKGALEAVEKHPNKIPPGELKEKLKVFFDYLPEEEHEAALSAIVNRGDYSNREKQANSRLNQLRLKLLESDENNNGLEEDWPLTTFRLTNVELFVEVKDGEPVLVEVLHYPDDPVEHVRPIFKRTWSDFNLSYSPGLAVRRYLREYHSALTDYELRCWEFKKDPLKLLNGLYPKN